LRLETLEVTGSHQVFVYMLTFKLLQMFKNLFPSETPHT